MHESLKISRIFWLTQRLADVPEHDDWLSHHERVSLAHKRFPKRRFEWRLGRWTAKSALLRVLMKEGSASSGEFSRIEIRPAADGAPEVFLDDKPLPMAISISHRDDVGFCAISPSNIAVGCDVEFIEPRSDAFGGDYFTQQEQEVVRSTADAERPRISMLIWSAKESALKTLRQGLRLDTREVEVEFSSYAGDNGILPRWHPLAVRYSETNQMFRGWWREQSEYVLTITASGFPDQRIELDPLR